MIHDELKYRISNALGHVPTAEQEQAMDVFARFMTDRREQVVMILRGSAGTGKTTLAAAIVKSLTDLKQKIILLAPTGRAAKVFSLYAGHPAYTIHRRIYRQKSAGDLSAFNLNDNLNRDTLFLVDEASMIASSSHALPQLGESERVSFGSGCLLDDLMQFVYNGQNCRLLLIGDRAQLPPVGEDESPALSAAFLRGYGMEVYECDLNQVLRQSESSGILWNATRIRESLERTSGSLEFRVESLEFPTGLQTGFKPSTDSSTNSRAVANSTLYTLNSQLSAVHYPLPQVRFQGFTDIRVVPGDELIESLASSYSRVGMDETMVITRSNKRANIYNKGIRNTVLDREEELCRGDRLMIVKNNYYWSSHLPPSTLHLPPSTLHLPPSTLHLPPSTLHLPPISFIANGDCAVVQRVRNIHEMHGFRFAEVTMQFPDYDDYELTAMVILDTLTSEAPALTREQQERLFNAVMEDYADIPLKADRIKKLKSDRYYNALQVKFAYAVTCHKAQGGQWSHIYLDQGYMTDDMLTPDYFHWLYTAFTRATEQLFLVNWPKSLSAKSY